MNKIKTKINDHDVELWYEDSMGLLQAVYKADGTPLSTEQLITGGGYNVKVEPGIIQSMLVCDARYVYVPDINAFVPRLLYVPAPMPKQQD